MFLTATVYGIGPNAYDNFKSKEEKEWANVDSLFLQIYII